VDPVKNMWPGIVEVDVAVEDLLVVVLIVVGDGREMDVIETANVSTSY
jgi:hypothetical protein